MEYITKYVCHAGLLSAGGMGLWHGVEYYEKEKIVGEEYYQQWSNVSSQFYFFRKSIKIKMLYKTLKRCR